MESFTSSAVSPVRKNYQKGFTLIELIVVVIIIGMLFAVLTLLFNPLAQINKAQNANREHDLAQIQLGLDAYFHDTGCYPTAISFGTGWSSGSTIYMTKVPEDVICKSDGTNCYIYQTDTTSSCPQWNVLYAQLASPMPTGVACPLSTRQCVPPNMPQIGVNYCAISGNIDCGYVTSNNLQLSPPTLVTPTPTSAPNATPTPGTELCGTGNYHACTGNGANGCNVLDANAEQSCKVLGGNMDCYCDTYCRVNGVSQCQ